MQEFQYKASLILLLMFILAVLARASMLRRKGIRVIVFGETDKSDFLLIPFVFSIVYAAAANGFSLPLWDALARPFWASPTPGWIGLALSGIAVVGIILALISFGNSFRIGIDESKPDELVTTGMFAISRNPIYVCFDLFFIGLFLIHRNVVIAVGIVVFALIIHRQILREEQFLYGHYGPDYEGYVKKVRRYL